LHSLGSGQDIFGKRKANKERLETPVSLHYCPSRRSAQSYPIGITVQIFANRPLGSNLLDSSARIDYAANGGDRVVSFGLGPGSVADAATYAWPDPSLTNGIVFTRSELNLRRVTDGTSHTYLVGEKYIDPNHYVDGESIGDNQGPYVGDDRDSTRWTDIDLPPVQDTANADFVSSFGSAHPGRFFMAMCDGSIQGVRYDIAIELHVRNANRADGEMSGTSF
jgi:hypothetical protein